MITHLILFRAEITIFLCVYKAQWMAVGHIIVSLMEKNAAASINKDNDE